MRLLVGIPTHKRPELLRKCLESIAAQEESLPAIEVFVADNDSTGRQGVAVVEQLAPQFPFPLSGTTVSTPGISAVRNAILNEARKRDVDFIAMIDDDETASPKWLVSLLAMQKSTSADVVGGPVIFRFCSPPDRSVIDSRTFRTTTRPAGKTSPLWGAGNFLVVTRSLTEADWPTFDNGFGLSGGEDREWFMRIARLGLSFAWTPNAFATEEVPEERATEQWILQRAYRYGNCEMRMAIMHGPSSDLFRKLAILALTIVSAPILCALLLYPSRRLWLLRAWWRAAGGASAIMGRHFQEYAVRHTPNTALGVQK